MNERLQTSFELTRVLGKQNVNTGDSFVVFTFFYSSNNRSIKSESSSENLSTI